VQVKDVAGVGLAAGRPPQQQRELAVGVGVARQVVVDDEHVAAVVEKRLGDGNAGVGRQVEQGRRIVGRGRHHHGVFQGAGIFQGAQGAQNGALALPDTDVDAEHVAALLVDDGIQGQSGLARLAIADDELALAATDGNNGVHGLEAGL
jgi:hypothetical protein